VQSNPSTSRTVAAWSFYIAGGLAAFVWKLIRDGAGFGDGFMRWLPARLVCVFPLSGTACLPDSRLAPLIRFIAGTSPSLFVPHHPKSCKAWRISLTNMLPMAGTLKMSSLCNSAGCTVSSGSSAVPQRGILTPDAVVPERDGKIGRNTEAAGFSPMGFTRVGPARFFKFGVSFELMTLRVQGGFNLAHPPCNTVVQVGKDPFIQLIQ
jgi:hypothetical protein